MWILKCNSLLYTGFFPGYVGAGRMWETQICPSSQAASCLWLPQPTSKTVVIRYEQIRNPFWILFTISVEHLHISELKHKTLFFCDGHFINNLAFVNQLYKANHNPIMTNLQNYHSIAATIRFWLVTQTKVTAI